MTTRVSDWLAVIIVAALVVFAGHVEAKDVPIFCSDGDNLGTVVIDSTLDVPPGRLTLVIRGQCVMNLVIERDDVTLTTDGVTPARISPAQAGRSVISVDGGRRVVIDGRFANGFSTAGGTFGIVVSRGGSLDVANCNVSGASNTGLIASNSGTLAVDACTVTDNQNGIVAANGGNAYVTNSTVTANDSSGLVATRNGYMRIGQDRQGNLIVRPVMVSRNGGNGIVVTDNSSANVVGGSVEDSGSNNIFVSGASNADIGLGSSGLVGGVRIRNAQRSGVSVDAGQATLAGNTIEGNGAFGVTAAGGSVELSAGNTITGNAQSGVSAGRGGNVVIGSTGANTISGNGTAGPSTGGLLASQGGSIQVASATIGGNRGAAVQAFQTGTIDLRATVVTVPAGEASAGATIQYGSTLTLRDGTVITSDTSDGIQATNLSAVRLQGAATVNGNGPGAFGVNCVTTAPMGAAAATLTGNLANVSGIAGASSGCNVFP